MIFDSREVIAKIIHYIEICLCFVIICGVFLGVPDVLRYMYTIVKNVNRHESYQLFSEFLKHVLMLIVGIELVYMIISHKVESMLSLVTFVIARKMLVYADNMTDIFIGTVAMLLVFVLMKAYKVIDKKMGRYDGSYDGNLTLKELRARYNIDLGSDLNLNSLLKRASANSKKPLVEGSVFEVEGCEIEIMDMIEEHVERVYIKHKK